MSCCTQTQGQSVLDHGKSVFKHFCKIRKYLLDQGSLEGYRIPAWLDVYKKDLVRLLPSQLDMYYYLTYHDCGKPSCRTIDSAGKTHFPGHSTVSAQIWKELGGSSVQCRLIELDMEIHQLKAEGLPEFTSRSEAVPLLLAGLSEVHSNAVMFGGIESTSFKIKWKQIDKRGAAICKLLFFRST